MKWTAFNWMMSTSGLSTRAPLLMESDFLKAIYLELKTDNTEEIKQKILDFGVKKLDVPDPHLYFRVQVDRGLSSWVSAKSSLGMRGHLHQDLDRPRRHRKCVNENVRNETSKKDKKTAT